MNKPNKNSMKYFMCETEYFYKEYVEDLEKYCEETERNFHIVVGELMQYKQALDKACEELSIMENILHKHGKKCDSTKQWKEHLLNGN